MSSPRVGNPRVGVSASCPVTNKDTLCRTRLVLGWVFGWANHLSISLSHSGQLGILPLAEREMTTSQSAVMLCGLGVKGGVAHATCG